MGVQELMEALARRAQHQLRMVLSEWYSWLSACSLRESDWKMVPWWAKRIPSQLDLPWALHELESYVDNPAMIKILYIKVDETYLAAKKLDGLPDMTNLHKTVKELYEAFDNG